MHYGSVNLEGVRHPGAGDMGRPASPGSGRVTLRAVAARAGISESTASRILAGQRQYDARTVDRVLAAAATLRYRPNSLVRGILSGRSRTIGVVVPASTFFLAGILRGIHDALAAADHVLLLSWNPLHFAAPGNVVERRHIHRLLEHRVDGLILRPTHDAATDDDYREILERRLPLVTVDRELPGVACDFAGTDDAGGARMAAGHLLGLGHRRLGHLAGPGAVSTARRRREGFERAVAAFGRGAACRAVEGPDFRGLRDEALRLLRTRPRPTAVFCANDDAAASLYEAADALRLRIPQDLSVVGFADLPHAVWMRPPLTTVRQDPVAIGREAARIVLARCAGGARCDGPIAVRVKPELIVRGSTAKPTG